MKMDLPTKTNHIESTHNQFKDAVTNTLSLNLSLQLARILQYIEERSQDALAPFFSPYSKHAAN